MSSLDNNDVATAKQPLELGPVQSNDTKARSIRFATPTSRRSTGSSHYSVEASMESTESESTNELSYQRAMEDSGTEHQSSDSAKVNVCQHSVSQRKRATIIFQLPGVLPEPDEIAEIWPLLVDVCKRGYNVAITHAKNRHSESIQEAATHTNVHESHPVDSLLPQHDASSISRHIQRPRDDDCHSQTKQKLARLDVRVEKLESGSSQEGKELTTLEATNFDRSIDSMLADSAPRPHALVRFAADDHPDLSPRTGVSAKPTTISSFNPPTPYPKVYGELSENGLRVRIAQVHDELRILNLALARRGSKGTDSEYSSSNVTTPASPEFP